METQDYLYDNETAKRIGDTIIAQMGGYGRLQSMLGAKNFTYSRKGEMTFQFKLCKKASHCRITYLEGKDLYKMEFIKIPKAKRENKGDSDKQAYYLTVTQPPKTVETFEDLYVDQLKPIFENFTGLKLSLF
jgi:curved DNA-binding protein CbpA